MRELRKRLNKLELRFSQKKAMAQAPTITISVRSGHATEDGWIDDDPLSLPEGCPARERSLRLLEKAAEKADQAVH